VGKKRQCYWRDTRYGIYQTNPWCKIRRLRTEIRKKSEARCPNAILPNEPIPIRVLGVHLWFTRRNCETKPILAKQCSALREITKRTHRWRAVQSFRFKSSKFQKITKRSQRESKPELGTTYENYQTNPVHEVLYKKRQGDTRIQRAGVKIYQTKPSEAEREPEVRGSETRQLLTHWLTHSLTYFPLSPPTLTLPEPSRTLRAQFYGRAKRECVDGEDCLPL
jgi:hypothetical protein